MPELHNFSDRSLKTITLVKEESQKLGHNFVGSEQFLIGLLGSNNGATQLINVAGARKDASQVEVEKAIGRGAGYVSIVPAFTPNARRVVEIAVLTDL
jgi:ATP-dependent Clp protease ATP-binding subunit ClpC